MKSIKELLSEARPAELSKAMGGIIGKFFTKRISVKGTSDGMVGLYRGSDGNAYIVHVASVTDSKMKSLFSKELSKK